MFFEKKKTFIFPENWQKYQKIVIITSTCFLLGQQGVQGGVGVRPQSLVDGRQVVRLRLDSSGRRLGAEEAGATKLTHVEKIVDAS
jgi:hypothetical protein